MATRAPRFQVEVDCKISPNHVKVDYNPTPNKAHRFSFIRFVLRILTFIEDDFGGLQEQQVTVNSWVMSEYEFGSDRQRNTVASRLLQAGWLNQASLDITLDSAFSEANSTLEYVKKNKKRSNNEFGERMTIIFRVQKIVRRDAEVTAMELSMREDPKFFPATKESINALSKVKLEDDDNGNGGGNCIICTEKLVSSKTEVVTRMPCSHLFHGDCIEEWLNIGHTCPLCRFPMPTNV